MLYKESRSLTCHTVHVHDMHTISLIVYESILVPNAMFHLHTRAMYSYVRTRIIVIHIMRLTRKLSDDL